MFTAKDLEVYKDSIKEKNRAPKTGEKPEKTPPSVAKISKLPLKLQNEEPNKERKPLSVVFKASNTLKDPHKPPSPTPVGTSKPADPAKKPKYMTPKSPSLGKLRTTDTDPLLKAPEFRSESLRSPRETLLSMPPYIKSDNNQVAGGRKVKEPSTHGANGVYQKSPSLSGAKAAPSLDVNASLCSECTRAASEGAVCFIGNDGRVSACTTRSAVRLCKNLNCAANNPEYVAAMANAPKKYLISKRHLLKAQYGPKSRSSRPKSPNLQQMDAGSDALSPSNGEMSFVNVDMTSKSCGLESDGGELSPLANGNLGLFDGDLSLYDASAGFNEGEMGLANDDMKGVEFVEDHATTEPGIAGFDSEAQNGAAIEEQKEFSFHEGEAGETESPKFSMLESLKEHIEARSAGNDGDDNLRALKLNNLEELDDEDAYDSPMDRASIAEESSVKNYGDTMSPNGMGEQVDADDESVNAVEPFGMSQVGDDGQTGNIVPMTHIVVNDQVTDIRPTIDIEQVGDDGQTGYTGPTTNTVVNDQVADIRPTVDIKQIGDDNQLDDIAPTTEINQLADAEQSGGITPTTYIRQVGDDDQIDDIVSTVIIGEVIDGDTSGGLLPIDTNQVADDKKCGDLTSPIDTHVAHEQSGEITSHVDRHVAVDDLGDDGTSINAHVADDAQSGVMTSLNDVITSLDSRHGADDHGDDMASLNGTHVVDVDQCDDVTTLNDRHVGDDDCGDDIKSPHGRHLTDDDHSSDDITTLHDRHVSDDDESSGGDENEDDAIVEEMCIAEDKSSIDAKEGMESTLDGRGNGGEDGSGTSSMKKGSKQRRRRMLGAMESSTNPETMTLRKQQTQERKQAEEWTANYAIEGVVQKLAPTGEAKVKILVEAFETIICHTDGESICKHKEAHLNLI